MLRNTVGRLEFTRTAEGAWLRETIDIRLDLRIVFWNLRRHIVRQWTEYTPSVEGRSQSLIQGSMRSRGQ